MHRSAQFLTYHSAHEPIHEYYYSKSISDYLINGTRDQGKISHLLCSVTLIKKNMHIRILDLYFIRLKYINDNFKLTIFFRTECYKLP